MTTCKRIAAYGLVISGLAGALGCEGKEYDFVIDDNPPELMFYSKPDKRTGMNATLLFYAQDKGLHSGIRRLVLFEDGKEIPIDFKRYPEYTIVPIKHTEPGTREYYIEATDLGGNVAKSKTLSIEFTGEELDLPPMIYRMDVDDDGFLNIGASDEGDNAGLESVMLSEDGEPIEMFKAVGDRMNISYSLLPRKEWPHTYSAVATDIGGNQTTSKKIRVNLNKQHKN